MALPPFPSPPPGTAGWPWTFPLPSFPPPDGGRVFPRITVVMPSYNQGGFVEAAIRSILLQDYPDLELIVMDGGSTDGTVEVLKKYEPWLAHWESGPDGGQTKAINKGFARATGQILTWINSDDFLTCGALLKLASHAEAWEGLQSGRPALAVGCGYFCDEAGRPNLLFLPPPPEALTRDVRFDCAVLQPAVLFNRPLWEKAGPLDEAYSWCFDWDFWIRSVAGGASVHAVLDFLAGAYQHGEQKTRVGADPRFAEMRRVLEKNGAGEPDYLSLVGTVHGLRRWFLPLFGFHPIVLHYARHAMARMLQLRYRRFQRKQIRDLMNQFGI